MNRWLCKSEPDAYGWDDLVHDGRTVWNGVRNHQAAANIRAMAAGDEALFYHSNEGKACVGVMRIASAPYPDPAAPAWPVVDVEPVRALPRAVTLAELKADPRFADLALVRQSRLSVMPVAPAHWDAILALAG